MNFIISLLQQHSQVLEHGEDGGLTKINSWEWGAEEERAKKAWLVPTSVKNHFKRKKLSTAVPIPNCKKDITPFSSKLSLTLLAQVPVLPFKERHKNFRTGSHFHITPAFLMWNSFQSWNAQQFPSLLYCDNWHVEKNLKRLRKP